MSYFIYILYSASSEIYYVGYTSNPKLRFQQHNSNEKDKFTGKHKPWKMVALFEVGEKNNAIEIERFIKRQKSKKLLITISNPDFIPSGKLTCLKRVEVALLLS